MRQPSTVLARVLAFVEIADLAPTEGFVFQDVVREIADQFSFEKSPQTVEQFDLKKGVEFYQGKLGRNSIDKFVIWHNLLVLETRMNTAVSKELLEGILTWCVERFSLRYTSHSVRHYGYISDVTFETESPILTFSDAINRLSAKCTLAVSEIWKQPVIYDVHGFRVGHDPLSRKNGIAPFSIERRVEVEFSENMYFSEAPLPTDIHIEMLRAFESEILLGLKAEPKDRPI